MNIHGVIFTNKILNASGCWCNSEIQLSQLYNSSLGGIISKSCTLLPKEPNPIPNYIDNHNHKFNCMGLPNKSYNYYKNHFLLFPDKPYILSIGFVSIDECIQILSDYESLSDKKRLVEINLSCPNIHSRIIGFHKKDILYLLKCISNQNFQNLVLGFKMPPILEIEKIKNISRFFNKYSHVVKFITCCNSLPNCFPLDSVLSNEFGGLSGSYFNKIISISNIKLYKKFLLDSIIIIGCGGIETKQDAIDYFKNGANFLQLASCFFENDNLNISKINLFIQELNPPSPLTLLNE